MLFQTQKVSYPGAGPWWALKNVISPGRAIRRVPPDFGGAVRPITAVNKSATRRLPMRNPCLRIKGSSCMRETTEQAWYAPCAPPLGVVHAMAGAGQHAAQYTPSWDGPHIPEAGMVP